MTRSATSKSTVGARPRGGLRYIPTLALATDLVLIALSVIAAILGRETIPFPMDVQVGHALDVAGPAMIIGWVTAIFLLGGYRPQVFGAGLDEYKVVINASLLTAAAVGIGCFLLRFPLSRGFFVLAFLVGIPALVVGRFLLRRSLHRARTLGALQHSVVIVGHEGHIDEIAAVLRREKWLGYNVVGALTPEIGDGAVTSSGIPLLGASRPVAQVAADVGADVVFLAGGAVESATEMRRLAWDLEHEDIAVVIAPSVTDVSSERVSVRPVGGMPLIRLEKPRSASRPTPRQAHVRHRCHPRPAAALRTDLRVRRLPRVEARPRARPAPPDPRRPRRGHLPLLEVPHHGPQRRGAPPRASRRAGLRGRPVQDGERPARHPSRQVAAPVLPRRAPQLVNVLTGDMSLVGPRPPLQHEVAQYDDDMARRLRVRPGITGLWQVSGRSDLSWSEASGSTSTTSTTGPCSRT